MDYAASSPEIKIKKLKNTAWIGGGTLMAAGIAFIVVYASYVEHDPGKKEGNDTNDWALPVSLACMGGAVVWTTSFLVAANHHKKKLKMLESRTIYQYDFKLTNGTSLSAGLDMIRDNSVGKKVFGLGLRYNF